MALDKEIIRLGEKNKVEELQKLIQASSANSLNAILTAKLGRNDCSTFWNYLLQGFDLTSHDARDKRYSCVRGFLNGLQKVELSYRHAYDLVTRLCQDLNTFANDQLIEILEHCIDGLRMGDPKCVSWKDLLPETLKILAGQAHLSVNGIGMTGPAYRNKIFDNLCSMKWPASVLTPIADMFKELQLSPAEVSTVLNKFSAVLQSLAPAELPALAYQLFSMCSTGTQIFVPILAFEKYFYRYYYKKLFADMESDTTDFDSIDAYSDKELLEAEETILHHLNYTTQYKISEIHMCVALKNFQCLPHVILTPFVLSALLAMSTANRDPDSCLNSSVLLTFIRSVFRSNEHERSLAEASVWCRDTLQRKQVDLESVFKVLIDQNKQGKDVITPGLVNLVFVLLKAKNSPALNTVAINFLVKFIRKRFVFGAGIVKRVAEWMIVEQEQLQYGECLMLLSVADTFTVSECVKTIKYVMDFFVRIPGDQAMRMMGFILPILKLSAVVRDNFIEVLRKAMQSSDRKTRRMAVHGFCMILKQLNNSNSQRSQMSFSGMCTQQSISGFSMMTQATLGQRSNPQRHFDMLTLEIIGLLRNCFNESLDIKLTLYENLLRSVEINPKLVPHVLQFIDWHFHGYFQMPQEGGTDGFSVHYHKLVRNPFEREHEIEVVDNLGHLILFVTNCLVIFREYPGEYDTRKMKRLLAMAIEKVIAKEVELENGTGSLTFFKCEMFAQQFGLVEGLMGYALLMSKPENDTVKHILPLFKVHMKLREEFQYLASSSKKQQKKAKGSNDTTTTSPQNITVNGVPVKKIEANVENVWDLNVLERFMKLLHEDIVNFAAEKNTTVLRSNTPLVCYVLEVSAKKIESIRHEPEYKQVGHSKRTLRYLTDITKVLYERCIKRLPELWRDFDMKAAALASECFLQCLLTANAMFKKKFRDVYLKGFDLHVPNNCKESPAIIHEVIDEFMMEDSNARKSGSQEIPLSKDEDGAHIPYVLMQCLEVLYDNIPYENRMATESYSWLLRFCKKYELHSKDMGIVHKLLFEQRQKTHSGAFFSLVVQHVGEVLGFVADGEEEAEEAPTASLELKSITLDTVESCLQYLYMALRNQIERVEYFIVKASNEAYKYRMLPEEDRDMCVASLRSLERSLCSQLVHISNSLLALTNVCIPLGSCMDALLRLAMQHFVCLKNLAKHLLGCCSIMKVPIPQTRFDVLLSIVGKRLPHNIYRLITYIEANIGDESERRKINPKTEKAKVLRETKLIPKIILSVENFNKHVIMLAKKTNCDRLTTLLHYGVVRDFRIKTSELKAAIERTLSKSSEIESVSSSVATYGDNDEEVPESECTEEDKETDMEAEEEEEDEEESALKRLEQESFESRPATPEEGSKKKKRSTKKALDEAPKTKAASKGKQKSSESSTEAPKKAASKRKTRASRDDDEESLPTPPSNENYVQELSGADLLDNLNVVNKKAKKRMLLESETNDTDVVVADEPANKRRRGRAAKR